MIRSFIVVSSFLVADIAFARFPSKLSEFGVLIKEPERLVAVESQWQSASYQPVAPLFSDYALKWRSVHVPAGATVAAGVDGRLIFPDGAVLTKSFFYPMDGDVAAWAQRLEGQDTSRYLPTAGLRLIETRVALKKSGKWTFLPYIWRSDQSDADLKLLGGRTAVDIMLEGRELSIDYLVPNFNNCQKCHSHTASGEKELYPIGFDLKGLVAGFAGHDNQIQMLKDRGVLHSNLLAPDQPLVDYHDSSHSLELRAKSYLHANCAHCHTPAGNANTSGLFLEFDRPVGRAFGLCKPPVAAGRGGGAPYAITPGHPERSLISVRMKSTEAGAMMPELGRTVAHDEGIQIIDSWILAITGDCGS